MQVVKQSKFGDIESVRYNLYLNSSEYNDLRTLLTYSVIPDSDPYFEDIRKKFIDSFVSKNSLLRLSNLCSQFCLEL